MGTTIVVIYMTKFGIYILNVAVDCQQSEILERAAGLTYRILLAFFPFLIFLMLLLGTMDIDEGAILAELFFALPGDIAFLVEDFMAEIGGVSSAGLISTALFFSVYNTSNGFRAVLRHLHSGNRGIVKQVGLSIGLMLLFSAMLIIMLGLLVFKQLLLWVIAFFVLVFLTAIIYALGTGLYMKEVLPGAVLTALAWVVVTLFFGFAVTTFTKYPVIYGSIAGVFILILWLNMVSVILLVGNLININLKELYSKWNFGLSMP